MLKQTSQQKSIFQFLCANSFLLRFVALFKEPEEPQDFDVDLWYTDNRVGSTQGEKVFGVPNSVFTTTHISPKYKE